MRPQKGIGAKEEVCFIFYISVCFFNDKSEAVRLLNQVAADLTGAFFIPS